MFRNGTVLVSTKHDIIRNLALEDWLYRNLKCAQVDLSFLLMWRNGPAVVIGRHQNPWLECNLQQVKNGKITLARRSSGGGTVYHDMGNLNCSFFSPRRKYDRDENLRVICRALKKWDLNVSISERHDMLWNGYKISGTASKLGAENAYHHCTLLLDVNRSMLHKALQNNIEGVTSKATRSVRANVKNLTDGCPKLNAEEVIKEIGLQYQNNYKVGPESFRMIEADENNFSGIESSIAEFLDWNWVFGKTPRFHVARNFIFPPGNPSEKILNGPVKITISVFHGLIESVETEPDSLFAVPPLLKVRFTAEDVGIRLNQWMTESSVSELHLKKFIASCCLRIVNDVYC